MDVSSCVCCISMMLLDREFHPFCSFFVWQFIFVLLFYMWNFLIVAIGLELSESIPCNYEPFLMQICLTIVIWIDVGVFQLLAIGNLNDYIRQYVWSGLKLILKVHLVEKTTVHFIFLFRLLKISIIIQKFVL